MAKQLVNEFADISALKNQEAEFAKIIDNLTAKIKGLQELGVSFSTNAKDIDNTKKAKDAIDEQAKAAKSLEAETAKLKATQDEAYKVQQQLIQIRKEAEKQAKLEAQATNQQIGAYKRLEAEAAIATQNFQNLAAEYGVNSKEAKAAGDRAAELNAKLKEVDATVGKNQRNVGNYNGAAMSLRQEIRTLTQTLAQMEMQGKGNSAEFRTMVQRLGQLKDTMGDVGQRAKFFADDARWITAASQAVNGLVGAYAAYTGVMNLVGNEDKELQKSMQKLQSLMAIMMGLTQVATALNKDSMAVSAAKRIGEKLTEIQLWASTRAQAAQTAATEAGTVAAKASAIAWNLTSKAMNKIPILAIVAAVASLVAIIWQQVSASNKQAEALENARKSSENYIETQKQISEIEKNATKNYVDQKASLDILYGSLKNSNTGSKERNLLIKQFNDQFGVYSKNLLTEKSNVDDIASAYNQVTDALRTKLQREISSDSAKASLQGAVTAKVTRDELENQLQAVVNLQEAWDGYPSHFEKALETNKEAVNILAQYGINANDFITTGHDYSNVIEQINAKIGVQIVEQQKMEDQANKAIEYAQMYSQKLAAQTYEHEKITGASSKHTNEIKRQNAANVELMQTMNQLNNIQIAGGNMSLMDRIGDGDKLDILIRKLVTGAITMEEFTIAANALLESSIVTISEIDDALYKINKTDLGGIIIKNLDKGKISAKGAIEALNELYSKDLITFEEYEKEKSKITEEQNKRREQIQKQGFDIAKQFTQEAFSTVSAYISQSNDKALSAITSQYDKNFEALQNLLDAGVISQEEYDQRQRQLEADRDMREREQKRKYAKQQRDLMAFQSIINTAAAITMQLATGVGPEAIASAIAVGIMGAIEVAAIYAQPLPSFYTGTDDAPEGLANVGERGFEYIQKKTGELFKTPNHSTVAWLDKGDKVYTHDESINLEKMLTLPTYSNSTGSRDDMRLIGKLDELTEAVKNKPSAVITMDRNGVNFALVNGNKRQQYVNNHIKYRN